MKNCVCESDDSLIRHGEVKWFDRNAGYGFIYCEEEEADILLHENVLNAFGRSSITNNSIIDVNIRKTENGLQATRILHLQTTDQESFEISECDFEKSDIEKENFEPARVKWHDTVKGYGFANVFRSVEDAFFHTGIVEKAGLTCLEQGEAVLVRTETGPRGLFISEIAPWNYM